MLLAVVCILIFLISVSILGATGMPNIDSNGNAVFVDRTDLVNALLFLAIENFILSIIFYYTAKKLRIKLPEEN